MGSKPQRVDKRTLRLVEKVETVTVGTGVTEVSVEVEV